MVTILFRVPGVLQKFFLNRLHGLIMRLNKLSSRHFVLLFVSILALCLTATFAQEKSGAADSALPSAKRKSPDAKKQAPPAGPADPEESVADERKWDDDDSSEQVRQRDEWFYKQRSSVNGHIPAGVRVKAFQHMRRMMEAEGKLVRQPDGAMLPRLRKSVPSSVELGPLLVPRPQPAGFSVRSADA